MIVKLVTFFIFFFVHNLYSPEIYVEEKNISAIKAFLKKKLLTVIKIDARNMMKNILLMILMKMIRSNEEEDGN